MKMKKPLILLVDETQKNIQLLGSILRKANFDISIATTGSQALQLLESIKPELILLDVMVPDMDGYALCERIKTTSHLRSIPVVFLTDKTDTENIVRAFDVGASDFVSKPYKTEELLARVRLQLELKSTRDELRQSVEKQDQLLKDKDKFISIISHDLRSPFQGILGLSSMLKNEYDTFKPDELSNIVDLLDSSLNSVYKLIENLLSWSLIEMGKYKLYAARINVIDVIKSQLQLYEIQLKDKGISVHVNCDETATLITDEQALCTVIRNLVSNAVKFTPRNGDIYVSMYNNYMDHIEFSVRDTGSGLEPEIVERVLGKDGMRLKPLPGTDSEQGSGIGLMLSRELVQLMGGEMEIKVEKNKGSNFVFRLPLELNVVQ